MPGTPAPSLKAYAALWAGFFAAFGLMGVYSPLWFQSLGLTPASIGLLLALPNLARLVSPYAWGWWGDHTGERVRLLRAASAMAAVAAAAMVYPGGVGWLALCMLVLALGQQGVVPLGEAAQLRQMQAADGSIDTHAYGRVRLWGSVGFTAAVALGGVLLQGERLALFPWACMALFGLAAAVSWWLPAQVQAVDASAQAHGALQVLRRPAVAWFFASIMAMVLAHVGLNVALSLYLESLGYSRGWIGLIWVAGVIAEVFFFWQQGRFFSRLPPHGWLMLTGAVAVVRFAFLADAADLTGTPPGHTTALLTAVLLLCQLTHALTFGAHHTACTALIARHFPDRLRGRGGALYASLGYGVPGVIGASAGGWLAEHAGYPAVFWGASLAAALGVLCAWRSRRLETSRSRGQTQSVA